MGMPNGVHVVMAYIFMAVVVVDYIAMAYIVMADVLLDYIDMF